MGSESRRHLPVRFRERITAAVTPEYFSTMQIQLLKGRYFATADGPSAPRAVIINQTLANYFWPHEDPIGRQMRFTQDQVTGTIVGVVEDVELYNSMSGRHAREMYVPFAQFPRRGRRNCSAIARGPRDACRCDPECGVVGGRGATGVAGAPAPIADG